MRKAAKYSPSSPATHAFKGAAEGHINRCKAHGAGLGMQSLSSATTSMNLESYPTLEGLPSYLTPDKPPKYPKTIPQTEP
jgi:hypothetical protein